MSLRVIYGILAATGLLLATWAQVVNPIGAKQCCDDDPPTWVRTGPYRFLKHPMYVGTFVFVVGSAGLAAGIWNCLAVGTVTELLLRDWARREGR